MNILSGSVRPGMALACVWVALGLSTPAAAQHLQWAKYATRATAFGMGVDASGNVYVAGTFQSTAVFGTGEANQTQLVHAGPASANYSDVFIAKYDSAGLLVWAKRAGGTRYDYGRGLAVDSSGNSCVIGELEGPATFGAGESNETTLTSTGSFLAKYNASGALIFARQTGGTQVGVAFDTSGNCYATGWIGDWWVAGQSATFGAGEANQTTLTSAGYTSVFVAKYGSTGLLQWARQAGGTTSAALARGIAVDAAGNSHLTGRFIGLVTFGAGGANPVTMSTAGTNAVFVAKYDTTGTLSWAKRAVDGVSEGMAIGLDAAGNSYVAGLFNGTVTFGPGEPDETAVGTSLTNAFVSRFDAAGSFRWVRRITQSSGHDPSIRAIAVDADGDSLIVGEFEYSLTFTTNFSAPVTIAATGHSDGFFASYTGDGRFTWAKRAGGGGDNAYSYGRAAAVDWSGNFYAAGSYRAAMTIGSAQAMSVTLPWSGFYDDSFVARFDRGTGIGTDDFDGDGRADLRRFAAGVWTLRLSSADGGSSTYTFGGASHTAVAADYDGDGRTDPAIYADGTWSILRTSDGVIAYVGWGGADYTPVPGDYDGDGKADIAVYHQVGVWSIIRSSDSVNTVLGWGGPGWTPVPGDYDGDGRTDIAVYSDGRWSIVRSSDASNTVVGWGGADWTPVPADYDGDGRTDIAVHRDGAWSIVRSSDGQNTVVGWGGGDWDPIPGDYDGDGKTDICATGNIGNRVNREHG